MMKCANGRAVRARRRLSSVSVACLAAIGLAAFRSILRDKRLHRVPMYLETPKGEHEGEQWDVINLRTLRGLAKR